MIRFACILLCFLFYGGSIKAQPHYGYDIGGGPFITGYSDFASQMRFSFGLDYQWEYFISYNVSSTDDGTEDLTNQNITELDAFGLGVRYCFNDYVVIPYVSLSLETVTMTEFSYDQIIKTDSIIAIRPAGGIAYRWSFIQVGVEVDIRDGTEDTGLAIIFYMGFGAFF